MSGVAELVLAVSATVCAYPAVPAVVTALFTAAVPPDSTFTNAWPLLMIIPLTVVVDAAPLVATIDPAIGPVLAVAVVTTAPAVVLPITK